MYIIDMVRDTFELIYGKERVVISAGTDVHLLNVDVVTSSSIDDKRYKIAGEAIDHYNRFFQAEIKTIYSNYSEQRATYSFEIPGHGWSAIEEQEIVNFVLSLVNREQTANAVKLAEAQRLVSDLSAADEEFLALWNYLLSVPLPTD